MVVARSDGARSPTASSDGEPLIVIDRVGKTYANGTVALDGPDRDFQAVGLRVAFNL